MTKIGDSLYSMTYVTYFQKVVEYNITEEIIKTLKPLSKKLAKEMVKQIFEHYDIYLMAKPDPKTKNKMLIGVEIRPKYLSLQKWIKERNLI